MKQLAQTNQQPPPEAQNPLQNKVLPNGTLHSIHRPIPAPDPDPEPNPAPDSVNSIRSFGVTPADWDSLFHALQQRLEHCVNSDALGPPVMALRDRQHDLNAVVWQCSQDMKLLAPLRPRTSNG